MLIAYKTSRKEGRCLTLEGQTDESDGNDGFWGVLVGRFPVGHIVSDKPRQAKAPSIPRFPEQLHVIYGVSG